jgi:DNA-binding MarR family transcriptional regulator
VEETLRPVSGAAEPPVGEAIERAVHAITRWASRPDVRRSLLAEGGEQFSPTDTWLLGHLAEGSAMRMRQLAEWQGVDKSTITAQINRLESRGLVVREADPSDRRAVLVRATAEAHDIVASNSATARALLDTLVASWSTAERSQLAALLDRFVAELDPEAAAAIAR